MKIRQAISSDNLILSSLCVDVQTLHAKYHPEIFKMPQNEDFAASFFNETLADPTISIFLAEEDEQALGYVHCKLLERMEGPFTFALRYFLVDQISVRPIAQGKGVGKALLQRVEILAKELNIHRIQLDSWGFNLDAHAFFQKVGFEKFTHRFWKNL
jgi:GNAT superfamily N-acetyltransferase